jgi:hypothetical protein
VEDYSSNPLLYSYRLGKAVYDYANQAKLELFKKAFNREMRPQLDQTNAIVDKLHPYLEKQSHRNLQQLLNNRLEIWNKYMTGLTEPEYAAWESSRSQIVSSLRRVFDFRPALRPFFCLGETINRVPQTDDLAIESIIMIAMDIPSGVAHSIPLIEGLKKCGQSIQGSPDEMLTHVLQLATGNANHNQNKSKDVFFNLSASLGQLNQTMLFFLTTKGPSIFRDHPELTSPLKPQWVTKTVDSSAGKLCYDNKDLFSVRSQARSIISVLDKFQSEGWPDQIDVPNSSWGDSKVKDTVASLNEHLKEKRKIRFGTYGRNKGFYWREDSEPPAV